MKKKSVINAKITIATKKNLQKILQNSENNAITSIIINYHIYTLGKRARLQQKKTTKKDI